MNKHIPHVHIVIGACILAITGYAGFSIWVVWKWPDATMIGDIIGTWKSFAVAAFAFWIGSSSGGKASHDAVAAPEDAQKAARQTADAADKRATEIEKDAAP